MFNKDFYPTPPEVIETMIAGLNLKGKTVLEPSAGSGNILTALKRCGAKTIACELNKDLAEIAQSKCDTFLKNDFMQVNSTEVSHIDFIIANPPFSCADRHIQHMWDIAPGGCEIISLCNYETIKNDYSHRRESLNQIIKENGSYQNLGDCFSSADRKTDVEVALIKLYKPKSDNDTEFDGYFDLSEEYEQQDNGIMKHSELREIVSRYVGAVKMFNDVEAASNKINDLIRPINGTYGGISFGGFEHDGGRLKSISRDEFKKKLQKSAWNTVFNKLNMNKYVTRKVRENMNKFVEQQTNVPFTLSNIYRMIEMIVGTHGSRMNQVIVEAFDRITSHYHENRHHVEGWKTNDCFMVNKRFILPYIIETTYSGHMGCRYLSGESPIDELTKALCYLTGTNYDTIGDLRSFIVNYDTDREYQYRQFGTWYDFGFLRIKGFKKGSIHCEFKDEKVWEKFNITAVKAKGWQLPTTTKHSYRSKEAGVELFDLEKISEAV